MVPTMPGKILVSASAYHKEVFVLGLVDNFPGKVISEQSIVTAKHTHICSYLHLKEHVLKFPVGIACAVLFSSGT